MDDDALVATWTLLLIENRVRHTSVDLILLLLLFKLKLEIGKYNVWDDALAESLSGVKSCLCHFYMLHSEN